MTNRPLVHTRRAIPPTNSRDDKAERNRARRNPCTTHRRFDRVTVGNKNTFALGEERTSFGRAITNPLLAFPPIGNCPVWLPGTTKEKKERRG